MIVFTQFTDTMDFLRQELVDRLGVSILCFSGRGSDTAPPVSRQQFLAALTPDALVPPPARSPS